MKIVHRYILREYIQLFLLCAGAFSVLSVGHLLFNLNDFLVGRRTPVSLVFTLLWYRLPMLLLDVVPAAVIFGMLLSVGRLAREHEMDVLRTSGWSLSRITTPLILATVVLSTLVFVWYDKVVPAANHAYLEHIRRIRFQDVLPMINENMFIKGPNNRYYYVRRINNSTQRMEGIMIFETSKTGYPRFITAETGRIFRNNWELNDGIIHELNKDGWVRLEAEFKHMTVDAGDDLTGFFGQQLTMEEMTRQQLKEQMERFGRSGFDVSVFAVEYYMKTAIPYASVILALIAMPFACLLSRKGRIWGVVFSFLVMLVYFFLQVVFRSFGQNHLVTPIMAAWGPNIIFLVIGLGVLYQIRR